MAIRAGILWSQLRLGVIVSSAITVFVIAVFFVDDIQDAFKQHYTLHFHTFTAQTLQSRAPVWLAGQVVGSVTSIEFLPPRGEENEHLRVELRIVTGVQPLILEGSTAQVITTGIVGQTVVNIVPARSGVPLSDGAQLSTAPEVDAMELSRRLNAYRDSAAEVAERWRAVLAAASTGDGTIARMRRHRRELDQLREQLGLVSALFDRLGTAAGGLVELLSHPEVRSSLGRLGPRIATLSERLSASPLTRVASDGSIERNLDSLLMRAERMKYRIENGGGSLGRALYDRSLSDELERTRQMLSDLRHELRQMAEGGPSR